MATSSSNLVHSLTEWIHKIKCKGFDHFLEYENVKDKFIKYKCLSFNKNYSNKIDKDLKKRFKNTFTISNNHINKFIFLLRKGVYPFMSIWMNQKKYNEILREKEEFWSNLKMEDITDANYMQIARVFKDFEMKNVGEYHDLYLKGLHYYIYHKILIKTKNRQILGCK